MKNQISVREAITAEETARFWRELGAYHDRDIFANAEIEEREYFHGSEYREAVQAAHDRAAVPAEHRLDVEILKNADVFAPEA